MIEIVANKIDVGAVIAKVKHPEAGGIDVFIGTTRNRTSNNEVMQLEFESHVSMAIKEVEKIIATAKKKWDIKSVAVSHRIGIVPIGEEAVVIAVACPHRKDAFESCRYIIDTLKQTVPIWKKEKFKNGEVWVAAHP
jgi:molybdopterin synthase catalytic subunit